MNSKDSTSSNEVLVCSKNNSIQLVCCSPQCSKPAFLCQDPNCTCLYEHSHCYKIGLLKWIIDQRILFEEKKNKVGHSKYNTAESKYGDQSAKQLFLFYEPLDLKCIQSNKVISKICCEPKCCHSSLHCQSKQCLCKDKHKDCKKFELDKWTNFLKERAGQIKRTLTEFDELQRNTLINMTEITNELKEMICFEWMETKYVDMLREIYMKKNRVHLTGKMAHQFCIFLQSEVKKDTKQKIDLILQKAILDKFIEQSKRVINLFQKLKSETISCLLKNKTKAQFSMISKIVNSKEDSQVLAQWLKNPSKAELIFRASEHQFSAIKFHQICDNIPHTLVIAKTEYGKRIGGYTPLTWNSVNNNYSNDITGESFIFSLDLGQKMSLIQPQKSIYCCKSFGPTFGYCHDLFLSNECNFKKSSFSNFPQSYNYNSFYKNGPQSIQVFCGAQSGPTFKVLEYEVFKITWK